MPLHPAVTMSVICCIWRLASSLASAKANSALRVAACSRKPSSVAASKALLVVAFAEHSLSAATGAAGVGAGVDSAGGDGAAVGAAAGPVAHAAAAKIVAPLSAAMIFLMSLLLLRYGWGLMLVVPLRLLLSAVL
jgi:hypothetical protein